MQWCLAYLCFSLTLAPCVSNRLAISAVLFHAAQCSGVWPNVSLAQISAPWVSNRLGVLFAFPAAAQCSGVASLLFLVLLRLLGLVRTGPFQPRCSTPPSVAVSRPRRIWRLSGLLGSVRVGLFQSHCPPPQNAAVSGPRRIWRLSRLLGSVRVGLFRLRYSSPPGAVVSRHIRPWSLILAPCVSKTSVVSAALYQAAQCAVRPNVSLSRLLGLVTVGLFQSHFLLPPGAVVSPPRCSWC